MAAFAVLVGASAVFLLASVLVVNGQFNPKLETYRVVTEYASTASGSSCTEFEKLFATGAKVLSPVGTTAQTPAAFCAKNKEMFAGMGAYPRDLWLGNVTGVMHVAFSLHVRAVSKVGCFVDWPSILVLEFEKDGEKVLSWNHYYDDGWIDAAIRCRSNRTAAPEEAKESVSKPLAFNIKSMFYSNVVTWTTGACSDWASQFSASGSVESPVGHAPVTGQLGIIDFCTFFKKTYPSFGAYPQDLFIADNGTSLATFFHIRALSEKKCHTEWPSILVVSFDSAGQLTRWQHYYDDGWNDAQLKC
ncbi:uncharacterized protein LOC135806226 [Sycon ciliatum]|uniref:uncharacterized protein LOC135806226 n=1 Tax=Sycon ciliatum TaxID=27933 RepID=UPI0031F6E8A0